MTPQQKNIHFFKTEGGKVRMNDLRLMGYSNRSLNTLRKKGVIRDYIEPSTDKAFFILSQM